MKTGQATGLQIAFLVYAVMLLTVPLSSVVVQSGALDGILRTLVEKGMHFFVACALIVAIPPMRRSVIGMLQVPIPPSRRREVAVVALLKLAAGFGGIAALAIWFLATEGPAKVSRMIVDADRQVSSAFSGSGVIRLLLATTIGPLVEEIVFRGFIHRAFERQWGWIASLLATSALFGLYHTHFWNAFIGSVILICLLRRTGSLWAPIVVHVFFNLMLWWPLLGQFVFPHGVVLTDPANWVVHGLCLALSSVAVPVYVYMSRDRTAAPTVLLEPNGALQK